MSWVHKQFTLPAKSRGSYLITDHVLSSVPEIKNYKVGLLNLFVQHTSCALSLNENCTLHQISQPIITTHTMLIFADLIVAVDSDVRADMSDALDRVAPEAGPKGEALYRHEYEHRDTRPAPRTNAN